MAIALLISEIDTFGSNCDTITGFYSVFYEPDENAPESWTRATPTPSYSLSVSVGGNSGKSFPIAPTILAHPEAGCNAANVVHNSLPISIQCIDQSTNQPVDDCTYTVNFSPGTNDGGHSHNGAARPFACTPDQCPDLVDVVENGDTGDIDGTQLTYAAPEVSGDVILTLGGTDPSGNSIPSQAITFNVQVSGSGPTSWISLSNQYLSVIINGADSGPSHALGYYGTPAMSDVTDLMGANFVKNLIPLKDIPPIFSQAGSLPWGGLYDIDLNWDTPHCGHRDGKTIDLSLSNLSARAKVSLQQAVDQSNMKFYYGESPNPLPGSKPPTHWHAYIQ